MYTSGSTGGGESGVLGAGGRVAGPKAVVQTHGGLLNRIGWQWRAFPFVQQTRREDGPVRAADLLRGDGLLPPGRAAAPPGDVVVRRAPLTFVDSAAEIFGTLLAGVPLWCPPANLLREGGIPAIAPLAEAIGATRISLLPSQLHQALRLWGEDRGGGWPWKTLNLAVVSGEPCHPSLPALWDDALGGGGKVLVNLYGQTETSGDVLCAVVGGDAGKMGRFPLARRYRYASLGGETDGGRWWSPTAGGDREGANLECLRWIVPCGLPIDGHVLAIDPINDTCPPEDGADSARVGRLVVSGPGVALGYINRDEETRARFLRGTAAASCPEVDVPPRGADGTPPPRYPPTAVLFDTSDLAHRDGRTGFYYVVGRAADGDREGDRDSAPHTTAGKVNGVTVHAAEVEAVFSDALLEVLRRRRRRRRAAIGDDDVGPAAPPGSSAGLNVVAVLFRRSAGPGGADGGVTAPATSRFRIAVFVEGSCLPTGDRPPIDPPPGDDARNRDRGPSSSPRLLPSGALREALHFLRGGSRDDDEPGDDNASFRCPPALIPNHAFVIVPGFPVNGAAGKVDRSALARAARDWSEGGEGGATTPGAARCEGTHTSSFRSPLTNCSPDVVCVFLPFYPAHPSALA